MRIEITESLKKVSSEIALGCLMADVVVKTSDERIGSLIRKQEMQSRTDFSIENLVDHLNISKSRKLYRDLGKQPSRYRVSSEALLRRVLQNKGMYSVNQVIDINNYLSIKYVQSIGCYDLDMINSPVQLVIGPEGATYCGIGKGEINISSIPVLEDQYTHFGSPTSDSERTMITKDTRKILMCVYSFNGVGGLETCLNEAKDMLEKYADAKNIRTTIIK